MKTRVGGGMGQPVAKQEDQEAVRPPSTGEEVPLGQGSEGLQANLDYYEGGPSLFASQTDYQKRSKRIWWIATLLFVAMTAVFVIATVFQELSPAMPFVQAFAEAAMIGALADWFAVVALFRRPLGLPIPHTGIISRNKSRIGRSIGLFVQKNFLTQEVLEDEAVNISGAVGRFLQSKANRSRVLSRVRLLLPRIVSVLNDEDVKDFLSKEIELAVQKMDAPKIVAKTLRGLTSNQLHESILDEVLLQLQMGFRANQLWFRQQLREASPWFIPEFVDSKIYDAIVAKAETTLSQALANKDHEFRRRLVRSVFSCVVRLETSEELQHKLQMGKQALLDSDVFRQYVAALRNSMLQTLERDVASQESVIISAVERVLEDLMETLSSSPQFQRKCNRIVRNILSALVGQDSSLVADLISRTVDGWDVQTFSKKLEEQVGADLQFIRINGTLVGGTAGVALYTVARYFH